MGWGISRTPLPRHVVRQALLHVGGTIVLALVVLAVAAGLSWDQSFECMGQSVYACMSATQYVLVFGPPVIMAVGAVAAFIRAYTALRRNGPWMVWHAAGWVLFVVMLLFVGGSGGALMSG